MAKQLNWGLLGTARINQSVIPPLLASQRNHLLAVASRDETRAREYSEKWSIPKAFGSYAAMLADPEIDVIYNSLPNSLHAEWTIRAAEAGKHVLCEKPLAISLEEVDAITAAARQNGVVVQEAFMYRHVPQTLKVQEMVARGVLGDLWLLRGAFRFLIDSADDVRLDTTLGGGSIWDVGCYPLDYTLMMLQADPVEVIGWQRPSSRGVDMSFAGQLVFPNGVVAQFDSSFESPERTFMELVGTAGNLMVPLPFDLKGDTKIILQRGAVPEEIAFPAVDLYEGEVENMADAILEGAQPRVSLAESRRTVAVILALLQSAKEGRAVKFG